MKRKDFEVMAPVGSYESLEAALQAGANSVYFGVEGLNMRSRSSANFTLDDLRNIVERCNAREVKTYLTVNTIIYNNELEKMHQVIECAKDAGVSAIIASDIAAILYARSIGVEVHISTQCNITNYEAVKFYAQFADVVVLARELDMDQVMTIHRQIVENDLRGPKGELIQIEMFSHGVKDTESDIELEVDGKYIMSPKDLCTIGFINKMIDAGVRVFKIEGRARSAEYVKTVCECYDEALNAYLDGSYGAEKIANWKERLSTVFNRGFWDGYYLGQRLGEWSEVYGSKATKKKVCIGKVTKYFGKLQVGEFKLESYDMKVGEEVLIVGPNTGVVQMIVPELRLEMEPVEKVDKGAIFSMPCETKLRRSDKLYKLVDTTEELMQ